MPMSLPLLVKGLFSIVLAIAGTTSYPFVVPLAQAAGPADRLRAVARATKGAPRTDIPWRTRRFLTLPNLTGVAASVTPTVVHVSVSGSEKVSVGSETSCEDENEVGAVQGAAALKKRMRQFQKQFGIMPPSMMLPVQSDGSGVIVRSDGIIITNAHVVEDAEVISVMLSNRREYPAKLVGTDSLTDIAVLKIEAENLPVAKLSHLAPGKPGDWVVAIGSPFGLTHSVTSGVVSATGRFFPGEDFIPFIQSDVAVNPGSSGGPLVNVRGEVIGINSGFMTDTTSSQGVSFSIPISLAWKIAQGLLRDGRVRHSRLGVSVQDLSDPLAKSFQLANPSGAVVIDVSDDSPAGKAGLEVGDVILSVDGKMIEVSAEIAVNLIMSKPGQAMVLGIWHRGAMRKIRLLLDEEAEKSEDEGVQRSAAQLEIVGLGLVVSPIDSEGQGGRTQNSGVLVRSVTGAAQSAGVRAGDVLLALNATPINNPDDAVKTAAATGRYVAALIRHGRERRYVPLYLETKASEAIPSAR
jgi:serine protease Do